MGLLELCVGRLGRRGTRFGAGWSLIWSLIWSLWWSLNWCTWLSLWRLRRGNVGAGVGRSQRATRSCRIQAGLGCLHVL